MSSFGSSSSNTNPFLSSSSSDTNVELEACFQEWQVATDELQQALEQPEGSRLRRRHHIERGRERGFAQLSSYYFLEISTYPDDVFRLRFRMRKKVFTRIVERLQSEMVYFQQRRDATGKLGISAIQKCTCAMRILAYGVPADSCDEYLRVSGITVRQCLSHFVDGVIDFFGDGYLRRPNASDTQQLLSVGAQRGFPGLLGSIDCMHWPWKNCPTAWKGQFSRGDHGHPTIILEAVASYDLWIWHAFFGVPGTCNDINVLDRSPVFYDVLQRRAPLVNFVVGGHTYDMGYYLTYGIYPEWVTFVKTIPSPQGAKVKLFAQQQESIRKDVERAFGVLQDRFKIVRNPARSWDPVKIGKIMRACIIFHNMIVEDERVNYSHQGYEIPQYSEDPQYDEGFNGEPITVSDPNWRYTTRRYDTMRRYIQRRIQLRDTGKHRQIREDLKEHIWQKFESSVGDN